ncbi:MAG: DUF4342 domain-containing protein [Clostridia bacterium]|nr:DUF4342 domain-containing protein [Clostridia bacterium]
MAAYTIEDIELIRRKSGISYQEAVALLDYHNGNVARALVDLERNGRINTGAEANSTKSNASSSGKSSNKNAVMELITKLYRSRIKINKGTTPILNLSVLFGILSLLISPHLVIIGVIVCLVLGYKFSIDKHDHAFDAENLERMVRNAAENVKTSVGDFARGFQNSSSNSQADASAADASAKAAEMAEDVRSYYAAKPASATYRPSAPTLNVPVQVESQDGAVTMESDQDGFNSATVE